MKTQFPSTQMGQSFWQKDGLINHILFELCLFRNLAQSTFFLLMINDEICANFLENFRRSFWQNLVHSASFWRLLIEDIRHLEDPICHQSSYMSQMQNIFFWMQVASSTLKLNDLIWAKNAKSWIPSSSSWGPINVAHLKNFGILDRHALQFLNVYSSVHPSIFKSYVFWVLQKLKWIWNLFVFW